MSNLKRYTLYLVNFVDIISCILSFILAQKIRFSFVNTWKPMMGEVYQRLMLVAIIAYIITNIMSIYNDEQYLKRSTTREFIASAKMIIYVVVLMQTYMFFTKASEAYSRVFIAIFAGIFLIVDFAARVLMKKIVFARYQNSKYAEKILIVGNYEAAGQVIRKIQSSVDWRFSLVGAVITDRHARGESISGIEIISDPMHIQEDILKIDADSVMLLPVDMPSSAVSSWIREFRRMGKPVHLYIDQYDTSDSYRKLDQIGDCAVISYHMAMPMPKRQMLMKRLTDILLGLILLPVFLMVFVIAWIFNLFESPGTVLIRRIRVGKNGHRFYQYRFRIYRLDADEKIRAKKLPLTAIGTFLKVMHLDGLPEILNVLSSEMSFFGPKAPSLPEFLKMSTKQRGNLSVPPGIVGYWSSEKSKSSSEIAAMDQEYVSDWNIVKDLSIFMTMFFRYITLQSSRRFTRAEAEEELAFIRDYNIERMPMEYDRSAYTEKKTPSFMAYLGFKRLVDILLSAAGIIILSPVMLVIAILVIADDGGTPLYGHERIGLHGRKIRVYKFRSMRMDAGDLEKLLTPEQLSQYQREFKIDNDPRILKLGRFLRKTSLDELPQLFNILGGSMSIIGPRPIVMEETEKYGNMIAKFLSAKPGLTGYWQAYARNNATYETGERQKMEMYYIDHQNLWTDIKIFFKTFISVFTKQGAQ